MSEKPWQPFPNTHWSLVRRAGLPDDAARREALNALLGRYGPALRSYLRSHWDMAADETDDVLQAFIADRILEYDLCGRADQKRGRFRTLLLTSLRNFATTRYRARKVRSTVPYPDEDLADPKATSAMVVEADWARLLVGTVLRTMRAECERTNRLDIWTVFEERLLAKVQADANPTSYGELAKRLKLASPTQAANLLVTGKRMFGRLLRDAVAEYELDATDVDEEIEDLRRLLSYSSDSELD